MIDQKELRRIYRLAHLELKEDTVELFTQKYNTILEFAESILEVDTTGVPFMEITVSQDAPLRADVPEPSLSRDEALQNAKEVEYGYFSLDRVLE